MVTIFVVAAFGGWRLWVLSSNGVSVDFYQFWTLEQAVEERLVEDIYRASSRSYLAALFFDRSITSHSRHQRAAAEFRRYEIQAASTPLLYLAFHLLASGDYEQDFLIYRILSLACSSFSVVVLCRLLQVTPLWTAVVMAFIAWTFAPLRDDLIVGNVNQLQLALITAFLWLGAKPKRALRSAGAGAVLGAGVLFKPNLAYVALLVSARWIIDGRRHQLLFLSIGALAAAALAGIAASAFFGSAVCWLAWIDLIKHLDQEFNVSVQWRNFGGARLLRDAVGINLSPLLNLSLLGFAVTALWTSRTFKERGGPGGVDESVENQGFRRDYLVVSIGAILPILTMGLAWPHYPVLAIPMCIYLLVPRQDQLRCPLDGVAAAFAAAGLVAILSVEVLRILGLERVYVGPSLLCSGTLLLFGGGVWAIWRTRRLPK
jgi:hypothetical protein